MKKSILNLKGAQELTRNELKNVNGGIGTCVGFDITTCGIAPPGTTYVCLRGRCSLVHY